MKPANGMTFHNSFHVFYDLSLCKCMRIFLKPSLRENMYFHRFMYVCMQVYECAYVCLCVIWIHWTFPLYMFGLLSKVLADDFSFTWYKFNFLLARTNLNINFFRFFFLFWHYWWVFVNIFDRFFFKRFQLSYLHTYMLYLYLTTILYVYGDFLTVA